MKKIALKIEFIKNFLIILFLLKLNNGDLINKSGNIFNTIKKLVRKFLNLDLLDIHENFKMRILFFNLAKGNTSRIFLVWNFC